MVGFGRSIYNLGRFVRHTVSNSGRALVTLATQGPSGMDGVARRWAQRTLADVDVETVPEDFERPLPDPAYVVLSNHTSHFDVLAIYAHFPKDLVPVAKRELGSVPVFGRALRSGAAIMIDRGNSERARASMEEAAETIRGGRSVLMFPEGTRTAGHELGPFKKGSFYLALGAGVPILPLAVLGASEVLPPGDWKIRSGGQIHVRMGRPIPVEGYENTKAGRQALSDHVRAAMQRLLEQRDPP